MHTRISKIIESLGLKKSEVAKRLGISGPFVSELCSGAKSPSDRTISDICREFNVNETWLRTGEGEMFVPISRDEEIEEFIGRLLHDEPDSFRKRLVSVLAKLTEDEWAILEEKARWLVNGNPENEKGG